MCRVSVEPGLQTWAGDLPWEVLAGTGAGVCADVGAGGGGGVDGVLWCPWEVLATSLPLMPAKLLFCWHGCGVQSLPSVL